MSLITANQFAKPQKVGAHRLMEPLQRTPCGYATPIASNRGHNVFEVEPYAGAFHNKAQR